ncbi:MAG: CXXX repeat peptide modification system protein [Lachnospiraceae bacterium]|nr:CXXX repeat peptide modification system protein [Lachnospiraceae bacterium]
MKNFKIKLLKEEVDEIELYFERMNSLKDLVLVFESDEVFIRNSSMMYEKIVKDLTDTRTKFQLWWTKIIDKYNLQEYNQDQLFVDFLDRAIKLHVQ